RLEQLVLWCSVSALRDAGWWEARDPVRLGGGLGLGAGWHELWGGDWDAGGPVIRDPEDGRAPLGGRLGGWLGLSGPGLSLSAACASGNYALGLARHWLRLGLVDVCLAGACDMAVTPLSLAGFGNLRALSRRNEAPAAASRPFDRGRDGFVM